MEDFNLLPYEKKQNSQKKVASGSCHILKIICIQVKTNSFPSMSDHSVVCFSLNNLFVTMSTQKIVNRN